MRLPFIIRCAQTTNWWYLVFILSIENRLCHFMQTCPQQTIYMKCRSLLSEKKWKKKENMKTLSKYTVWRYFLIIHNSGQQVKPAFLFSKKLSSTWNKFQTLTYHENISLNDHGNAPCNDVSIFCNWSRHLLISTSENVPSDVCVQRNFAQSDQIFYW